MEETPGIDIGGAKCGPTTQSSGGTAAEELAALCWSVEFDSIRQEPLVAGSGRVDVASDAQGHELQIHLSWPSHSTLLRGGAPARALLTITRRNHLVSSGFNAEAVIAVPLRLTLAP